MVCTAFGFSFKPQFLYILSVLIISQENLSVVEPYPKKLQTDESVHSFSDIIYNYINTAKREAPATVMMPAATMAREDMAPSTAPISIALEVPMA